MEFDEEYDYACTNYKTNRKDKKVNTLDPEERLGKALDLIFRNLKE